MYPIVPAAAIGNPSAADVATALWILTLLQTMNGTEMNPPPAPTRLEMNPIPEPTPNIPAPFGSSREGLGLRSSSICSAEKPTKTANTIESQKVGRRPAIWAPIRDPTRIPGARILTTGQSTTPRLWCAFTEDSDVN